MVARCSSVRPGSSIAVVVLVVLVVVVVALRSLILSFPPSFHQSMYILYAQQKTDVLNPRKVNTI